MKKLLSLAFIVFVSISFAQTKTPCTFTLSNKIIDSSCAVSRPYCTGEYSLTAIGGTPPYIWPNATSSNTIDTVYSTCPGTYTVNVTDNAGCTGTTTVTINQYQTPIIIDSIQIVKPSCPTCCDGSMTAYIGLDYCNGLTYTYQWTPGGAVLNKTISNICAGVTYTFCITDGNNYTTCDTSRIPTAPNQVQQIISAKFNVDIYPNPSNGKFNIQIVGKNQNFGIEVYNMFGEKVYSQFSTFNSQFSIDLSSQPVGIYLYRITSEKGEYISSGKLVIEK